MRPSMKRYHKTNRTAYINDGRTCIRRRIYEDDKGTEYVRVNDCVFQLNHYYFSDEFDVAQEYE